MSSVSDFINSIPQDAATVGNTIIDAGSHAILPFSTTQPGRMAANALGNASNFVAKLRGAPLYGQPMNSPGDTTQENGALSPFTAFTQQQLRSIPLIRQDPAMDLPQTDLIGDTGSAKNVTPFGALTIDPNAANIKHPLQRQIVFPSNQETVPGNTLNYEYNHALTPPVGYNPSTVIRDFESMQKTHPEMYNDLAQSLRPFPAPTDRISRESYAAELMSNAAQKYGTKILDTPLGIYYNNVLKPEEGQSAQGSLPNSIKGVVQGYVDPITSAIDTTNQENSHLPPAYHNPSQAFMNATQMTGNLAKNTVLNPRLLSDVAAVAAPVGMGGTLPIVSGALSGGLNAAAAPHPTLQGVVRNALVGGAVGGVVQGANRVASDAFTPQTTQTIGQIQEANQRANGLGLLADYDTAARMNDTQGMERIVQQILGSTAPGYAPYKQVFARLSGL